jgi:hypothetical protein
MNHMRDIKTRARGDLHQRMSVPANYYAVRGAEALPVTVRIHTKFDRLGELKGIPAAERSDVQPKAIFLRSEVAPVRNAFFVVDATESFSGQREGYRLGVIEEPDGITQTANLTVMTQAHIDAEFV